ncbi:MAG: hypothetical protein FD189_2449, partial [Elusimicrobia bacterium]
GLLVPMNRRMPNGTYGGVVRTAGEIITRLLPDCIHVIYDIYDF